MTILEKIDALRKERGWSVNYLALEAMLTQSTLNNLYSRKTDPKISTLRAICDAFGITLAEFFADEPTRSNTESDLIDRISSLSAAQKNALLRFLKTVH